MGQAWPAVGGECGAHCPHPTWHPHRGSCPGHQLEGGKRLRQAEAGTAVLCHLLSGGERGLQAAAPMTGAAAPMTGASRSGLSVRSEVAAGAPSLLLCPHAAAHHAGVTPRPGSASRVSAAGDGVGGSVAEVKTDSLPEALPVSALSAGSSSRTSPSPALAARPWCFVQARA